MLRDHRKLRRAPELVLRDRVQHLYPSMITGIVERMFRVDNPHPKPGLRAHLPRSASAPASAGATCAATAIAGLRTFG